MMTNQMIKIILHSQFLLDYPLVSEPLGHLVCFGGKVGVERDLNDSVAVSNVDKDQAAVVSPPVDPTGDGDLLTGVLRSKLSAAYGL